MEILKLSRITVLGATPAEPNGVLIKDGDAEYHVLNEALVNTVILPQLLQSGYKLVALPNNFEKNGINMSRLPIETYNPDEAEQQRLYDMIGAKYNNGDFSSILSSPTSAALGFPETNYSITTREAFLKYLDSFDITQKNAHLPINYFVSQAALFTVDEYFAQENSHYRKIIERHRSMSYRTFWKLYAFLKKFGINENSSIFDINHAYFAWGIDGIKWEVMSSNIDVVTYPVRAISDGLPTLKYVETTVGLTDNKKSKIVPADKRDRIWEFSTGSTTDYNMRILAQEQHPEMPIFPDGVGMVVDYESVSRDKHCKLICGRYTIEYDRETVVINQNLSMNTLRVYTDTPGDIIPITMAIPAEKSLNEFYTHDYITAISKYILEMRHTNSTASSYKLFLMFGLTPAEAITYIAHKEAYMITAGWDGQETVISEADIEAFVSGNWQSYALGEDGDGGNYDPALADEKYQIMNDIVNGEINTGDLGAGKGSDSKYTIDSIRKEVFAIHSILGISLNEIYERVKSATRGDVLTFTGNNLSYRLELRPIDAQETGKNSDLVSYTIDTAGKAYNFCEVLKVAREVGDNDCQRHVGIELLMCTTTPQIKEILDIMSKKYADKVRSTVVDPVMQNKLIKTADIKTRRMLFGIYHTGKMTYTDLPGKPDEPNIPAVWLDIISSNVKRKFDSIDAFTKYALKEESVGNWLPESMSRTRFSGTPYVGSYCFNIYCVNAYITPQYVIPKKGCTIPEVSIKVLWDDYRLHKDFMKQCVEAGIFSYAFTPYSADACTPYIRTQFIPYTNVYEDPTSLAYYMLNTAKELKDNKRKHVCTHPTEYLYPGIYPPVDDSDPHVQKMDIHLGYTRQITYDTYKSVLNTIDTEQPAQYYSHFTGFDADTYYMGVNPYTAFPADNNPKQLMFEGGYFITVDTKESYDYTRVIELMNKGYPIKQVHGNYYIARLFSGEIMEVVV